MNILKEMEKNVFNCKMVVLHEQQNAKRFKNEYKRKIESMLQANEKFIDSKEKELQKFSDALAILWKNPHAGIIMGIRRVFFNYHINKISGEITRAKMLEEELEELKKYIYLVN